MQLRIVIANGVLMTVAGAGMGSVLAQSPGASLAAGTWGTARELPAQRAETTATVLDDRIYIPGGLDKTGIGSQLSHTLASVVVYDPATDSYSTIADMPDARDHAGITTLDGRIYVSGGGFFGVPAVRDNLWVWDPVTAAWSELAPMPLRRWQHAMVGVDGKLYVIGGIIADQTDYTPMWVYDIASDTWSTDVAPLPTQREHLSAIAIDGLIWVIGGRWVANLPMVEIYDPATDTWTRGPDMPTPRGGMTIGLIDGVIHATGGEDLDAMRTYGEHEGLNIATRTWATYAPLPTRRHGLMSGVVADRWYVMGGGRAAGLSTWDANEVWTP